MKLQALPSRHSQRGYSLAEMLVVVAIVGILSLVTVPSFLSMYQSGRIKAAARTMTSDIRTARQMAITNYTRVKISFGTGANVHHYEMFREQRDRLSNTSTWVFVRRGDLSSVLFVNSTTFQDAITGDDALKDIVFLPNGTVSYDGVRPGLPPGTTHLELKTNQKVPKQTYQLKFEFSGNVTLL